MMKTELDKDHVNSYIIQSMEEEIKRIALELHEGVGQTLYSLLTGIQFIETAAEQNEIKKYISDMAQSLEKTIQEVRLLAVELHPPALISFGLLPALKSYLKLYTSTYGVDVELEINGEERPISPHERITLFRVCQEALANIARYADTMRAEILITWCPDHLSIIIKDDGKGFDVEKYLHRSLGLEAMKERMHLIGGKWGISSIIGKGTTIEIYLPL